MRGSSINRIASVKYGYNPSLSIQHPIGTTCLKMQLSKTCTTLYTLWDVLHRTCFSCCVVLFTALTALNSSVTSCHLWAFSFTLTASLLLHSITFQCFCTSSITAALSAAVKLPALPWCSISENKYDGVVVNSDNKLSSTDHIMYKTNKEYFCWWKEKIHWILDSSQHLSWYFEFVKCLANLCID